MSCSVCNKKNLRSSDCVTCDICRGLVHSECAGLSKTEVDCIRSMSRKIHFYCEKCDIVATINGLKEELANVKYELNELKNNQSKVIDDHDTSKKLSEEDIINEIEDRNRRATNLILFNLPESNAVNSDMRKDDDKSRCQKIMIPESKSESVKIMNCVRLGRLNDDKIRPIKIIFGNSHQALEILKSYKRKENLYLNRDLTPRQQNHSFLIRSEFRNRIEHGENDISLKYRDGIPKIVKKDLKENL
ncbi:hypothetical protein Zmor_004784 [Zophobas morio]|uniref:PHD-type domain-containing protein n=1 Tax=Zophobas morio TaxID=2755281 RepID=A0AA38IMU1_9CUCU|nr:hypothetical protein Zmor_004784 [Zophobas morio]